MSEGCNKSARYLYQQTTYGVFPWQLTEGGVKGHVDTSVLLLHSTINEQGFPLLVTANRLVL